MITHPINGCDVRRPLTDADVPVLARVTLGNIRLSRRERRDRDDLLSVAAVAGLSAIRSAESRGVRPARRFVLLAMQSAVYRELHRPLPDQMPAACDGAGDALAQVEDDDARRPDIPAEMADALAAYLPLMAAGPRALLERWVGGESLAAIGVSLGIARATVWLRIDVALADVRRAALADERRSWGKPDGLAGRPPRQGVPEGGGKNHFEGGRLNGWSSEFRHRAKSPELCVLSGTDMAEHTHVLLETLIAEMRANTAEIRALRDTLTPPVPEKRPAEVPDPPPSVSATAPATGGDEPSGRRARGGPRK